MKGWIGAGIASIAILITLFLDPGLITSTGDITNTRFIVAGILLSLIAIAFILGQQTSEIFISRYAAFWSAGLGLVTIGAVNIDLFTNTHVRDANGEKIVVVEPVKKTPKKPKKAAAVYHPDTLKINRVERIVDRNDIDPLARDENTKILVENKLSSKSSKLPADWKPSQEEKDRFAAFLKSQGLTYDPKTAFQLPPPSSVLRSNIQSRR